MDVKLYKDRLYNYVCEECKQHTDRLFKVNDLFTCLHCIDSQFEWIDTKTTDTEIISQLCKHKLIHTTQTVI